MALGPKTICGMVFGDLLHSGSLAALSSTEVLERQGPTEKLSPS